LNFKKKPMDTKISSNIPDIGKKIAVFSGKEMIDRVGQQIIKDVVNSILCGGNVRALTEGLTRKRLTISNAAMLMTLLNASKNIDDFNKILYLKAGEEIFSRELSIEEKAYLTWIIGLTGKSIQNVLRGDKDEFKKYLDNLDKSLAESVKECEDIFGNLNSQIKVDKENYLLNWHSILQLFTAIGAQTLALRGSEKSMYGKLFEKLILGSLLTILGFKLINPKISKETNKVFWLSEQKDKRESDATLLVRPGVGVRFDIGFIGPGNSEISLDKVSRFEREMEFGRQKHFMTTLILVDRIGEGSRIKGLAKNIKGHIVQMSMSYWVKEVGEILAETTGYEHDIRKLHPDEGLDYIKKSLAKIDLNQFFINGTSAELF
jgi:hypothetical protein